MKILHLISALEEGGAAAMLENFASACRGPADADTGERLETIVVSMTSLGATARRLEARGVETLALGMRRGAPDPRGWRRLRRLLYSARPDILQSWLYHADLLAAAAALTLPRRSRPRLVWGIHHENLDAAWNKRGTLAAAGLCARASAFAPDAVICCSRAARDSHLAHGYAAERLTVIPNGVDAARFRPDPQARAELRREFGVPEAAPLIGFVARYHPLKDHATFVDAAAKLARAQPAVRFLLCGPGVEPSNSELTGLLRAAQLSDRVLLLGPRGDVPRLLAACDMAALTSRSEAFPLALVEAMACGLPCTATAVGDCARILADPGLLAPPGDAEAIAQCWLALLAEGPAARRARGRAARERVLRLWSSQVVAERYLDLYRGLLASRGAAFDAVRAGAEEALS